MNRLLTFTFAIVVASGASLAGASGSGDAELVPQLPDPVHVEWVERPTRIDELFFSRIAWGLETTLDQTLLNSPVIASAAIAACREFDACRQVLR